MTQVVTGTLVLWLGFRLVVDQFLVQHPPPVTHYSSYSLYLVAWNRVIVVKVVQDDPDEKMGRDETGLARQVPEPEWYPAGSFGACISQSPKQNRSNICLWQARQ